MVRRDNTCDHVCEEPVNIGWRFPSDGRTPSVFQNGPGVELAKDFRSALPKNEATRASRYREAVARGRVAGGACFFARQDFDSAPPEVVPVGSALPRVPWEAATFWLRPNTFTPTGHGRSRTITTKETSSPIIARGMRRTSELRFCSPTLLRFSTPGRAFHPTAEPMVRGLAAGGRWIRTSGSAREALSRFNLLRFIYVQKDQSDGGAHKAKAKRGQHDTPVKAVREPADWNLEREPAKHRHQHGHCDRLARCLRPASRPERARKMSC